MIPNKIKFTTNSHNHRWSIRYANNSILSVMAVFLVFFSSVLLSVSPVNAQDEAEPRCFAVEDNVAVTDPCLDAYGRDATPASEVLEPGLCYRHNVRRPEGGRPFTNAVEVDCAEIEEILNDTGRTQVESDCTSAQLTSRNCQIVGYLVTGINLLTALSGMAIIGSIMVAGYQYMTAQDNSGQIQAAKKRIIWALVALGLLLFMYGILNWLVPGGVLGTSA